MATQHQGAMRAPADPASTLLPDAVIADLRAGYTSLASEHTYSVAAAEVEGKLPPGLVGTLFRNGPGLLEIGSTKLDQPFDGDGMVCSFTFTGDGSVRFSNRYVQTAGYVAEKAAGKMLFKGAFATGATMPGLFNPFDFNVKNVANTHVVAIAGRLWALWEGGLPHELDPASLETKTRNGVAESSWDGAISGKGPFGAHYKLVGHGDAARLVNIGAGRQGDDAAITFYEFHASTGKLARKKAAVLKGDAFGFFHDALVTPSYYIVTANPMRMDLGKLLTQYMFGRCSIAECLVMDKAAPLKIHVVPRGDTGGPVRTFLAPSAFVFHHVNAFESGPGQLVCDSIAWRSVDFSSSLKTLSPSYYGAGGPAASDQRSELVRYTLDLSATSDELAAGGGVSCSRLVQRPLEFPCIAPSVVGQPHSHSYACGSAVDHPTVWGPAQTVVKVTNGKEAAVCYLGPRCFTQEPVFVPRSSGGAEDDGWLLCLVWNAERRRTQLVVLDAQRVEAGPVATVTLQHAIPFGLHGSWTPQVWHHRG